ncbi:MAG: alpha/beta hydrolase, partial [Dermatophilaceae bacterium]
MTTEPARHADPTAHLLDAPGATIAYDVRGDLADATADRPVLVMLGSPMDAGGFITLAGHFTDRPVVTYDPRGVGRSRRTDDATESTPAQHAEDIRRVIEALVTGPVDLFATSGGAVNSLALVATHPDLVATLVAHEPPLAAFLPDRDQVLAANRDIGETYQRSGFGPAMAKFLQLAMMQGPLPASYADQPDPDPAEFGLPTHDDGSRDDPLLGQNNRTCVPYEPDVAALTGASTRVVVVAGEESLPQLTGRAAASLAEALGVKL